MIHDTERIIMTEFWLNGALERLGKKKKGAEEISDLLDKMVSGNVEQAHLEGMFAPFCDSSSDLYDRTFNMQETFKAIMLLAGFDCKQGVYPTVSADLRKDIDLLTSLHRVNGDFYVVYGYHNVFYIKHEPERTWPELKPGNELIMFVKASRDTPKENADYFASDLAYLLGDEKHSQEPKGRNFNGSHIRVRTKVKKPVTFQADSTNPMLLAHTIRGLYTAEKGYQGGVVIADNCSGETLDVNAKPAKEHKNRELTCRGEVSFYYERGDMSDTQIYRVVDFHKRLIALSGYRR